ncbi:MAG: alkyl sulfatase dimerization domain-containing protein [Promethearchaeota archaeon]
MSNEDVAPLMAISEAFKIVFKNPLEGVYTASLPIAGCAWIETNEGVVLIDTLLTINVAKEVAEKIAKPIKYIIYTHGHMDHVGGAKVFMKDNPEVIASKYLPNRFDKYKLLAEHRAIVNSEQFNLPKIRNPVEFVYPTSTFLGNIEIKLGDKTFELHTTRAETDDALWVYVPELNAAFIGDLMIGTNFPNIGNPWKPTRFALDWAQTLEEIRELKPEYIFCNGAGTLFKGNTAIDALNANIEAIRSLHDQVIKYINEDMHITEMIHAVKLPKHLEGNRFLKQLYSRTEFFVFNVYRWYHGYYDHNPAHLIPRPEKEVMREIFNLIGDPNKIINRVNELFNKNQTQLALQILDILLQADPNNITALKLRIKLVKSLGEQDTCLMSRNAYYYSIKQDKKRIRSIRKK